jgi:beta-galactosidase
MRISCAVLCVLLLAPPVATQDRPPLAARDRTPGSNTRDFFPFSAWYVGGKARAPMVSEITPASREEWRTDLAQIKALGFNTVRTWVEWSTTEPRRGEYHFENLRLLFEVAREVGLRVFIQMYADSAPDWVGREYPHTRFVAQNGYVVPPQSAPGYCTDNPEIAQLVQRFYSAVAAVAAEYPHFYGWDLWSEPHIINWAGIDYIPNAQYCYCHGSQARFREWLRQKYSSLSALNTAWHRGFATWDEVEPPRFSTILTYADYTDWKTFIRDRLAGDLARRDRAIRQGGSNHVITSHAAVSAITQSPRSGSGSPDDFLMAKQVDYYGTSIYPKHNQPASHWPYWRLMSIMDFQRSANIDNGGWYVGEFQAGPGTIGLMLSEPVTPTDQRNWAWSAIAYGAKGINVYAYYPMSSGYESGGYGLVNLDGTLTERAVKAGETARVVDANQKLLIHSRPVSARVGIVYERMAQLVGGQRGGGDNYHDHLVGYYRVFAEHNIPVDFVHASDLEAGDVSPYELLVVPYPLMMTRRAADGLKQFVERGGFAVAEARLAWNDERGFASEILPGLGLHEVFGVREQDAWMASDVSLVVQDTAHPALARLERNDQLRGTMFANTVRTISPDARVLATINGEPAVVSSRYGQGQTMFVGSFIGAGTHQSTQTPSPAAAAIETVNTGGPSSGAFVMPAKNVAFVLGLADWAGIERPVSTTLDGTINPPLVARLHDTPEGQLLFLISYNPAPQQAGIDVTVRENGRYALRNLLTGDERIAAAEGSHLRLQTSLEGKGVQVWELKRMP